MLLNNVCILDKHCSSQLESLLSRSHCIQPIGEYLSTLDRINIAVLSCCILQLRLPNHWTYFWCPWELAELYQPFCCWVLAGSHHPYWQQICWFHPQIHLWLGQLKSLQPNSHHLWYYFPDLMWLLVDVSCTDWVIKVVQKSHSQLTVRIVRWYKVGSHNCSHPCQGNNTVVLPTPGTIADS